jgi:hypothetical protein
VRTRRQLAGTVLAVVVFAVDMVAAGPARKAADEADPPAAATGEAAAEPGKPSTLTYREAEDDPPAPVAAREDPLARSTGARIAYGHYVHVQVNVDGSGANILNDAANEPSIAVDPTDQQSMVIGWRQFDNVTSNFRQAGYAYTADGGDTWTFPGVLTPGTFRSDPVLDSDSGGDLFYQSLQGDFSMDTFKSTDQGAHWSAPVPSFGGDKNWMVVDKSGGIGDGNVYGIWRGVFGCCGDDVFTRSTNGGTSFQPPVPVIFNPGLGTMAVGPSGELYAAGIDERGGNNEFVVTRSLNAENPGATPTFTGTEIDLGGTVAFGGGANPGGLMGQVNVAVNRLNSHVYVLASVDPFGADPVDVHFARSTDGGQTWSLPVRVNNDASGNYNWMGAMAAAPNGRIDAIWNDTRVSGQTNISALFYAYSWDGGVTWLGNTQVSPSWDSFIGWPNQNKIGDYYTLVSGGTGADVAWAATFNGEQDVYYLRLFPDCNGNGVSDVTEVSVGLASDCNENHVPDGCEGVSSCGPAGAVPDGRTVQGLQMRIARADGGAIALTWGASCLSSDSSYEIYEGTLGDFASHTQRECQIDGTSAEIVPSEGSRYYLVVPRNGANEGSYGVDSDGTPRPPDPTPCLPQDVAACFT